MEAWDAGTFHTGRDLTWQGNKLIDNVFMNNDSDATANFPCIGTTTSCAKVAIYLDDHQSGVTVTSNVISGFWTGVFLHFGSNDNVSNNLFIGDGLSVAVAACEVNDTTCNPPLSDPANALAASLNATMSLPEWETVWLPHYPALRNVTWSPGATVNNTVSWMPLLCRSRVSVTELCRQIDSNVVIACSGQGFPTGGGSFNATSMPGAYRSYVGGRGPPPVFDPAAVFPMRPSFNASSIDDAKFTSRDPVGELTFTVDATSPIFRTIPQWRQIPAGAGPRHIAPPPPVPPTPRPRTPPRLLKKCGDTVALPNPPTDESGPTLLYLPPSSGSGMGTLIAAGQGNNASTKKVHLLMARSDTGGANWTTPVNFGT